MIRLFVKIYLFNHWVFTFFIVVSTIHWKQELEKNLLLEKRSREHPRVADKPQKPCQQDPATKSRKYRSQRRHLPLVPLLVLPRQGPFLRAHLPRFDLLLIIALPSERGKSQPRPTRGADGSFIHVFCRHSGLFVQAEPHADPVLGRYALGSWWVLESQSSAFRVSHVDVADSVCVCHHHVPLANIFIIFTIQMKLKSTNSACIYIAVVTGQSPTTHSDPSTRSSYKKLNPTKYPSKHAMLIVDQSQSQTLPN